MRRAIATSAAAVLALGGLVACGDDSDDAAGSPDAFCEQLRAMDAEDAEGLESEVALDRLEQLIAIAPQEIRGDLQVLHDAFSGAGLDDGEFPDEDEIDEIFAASERVERYGVEECGLAPGDDLDGGASVDPGEADDAATADLSGDGSDPVPEADIPTDVTLTLQEATTVTWDAVDDAFDYQVEVDGEVEATTFGLSHTVLGALGDVTVTAVDVEGEPVGEAPGVSVDAGEALVVEWTEEPGASYYIDKEGAAGSGWGTVTSPHVLDGAPDDYDVVRFGPGLLVTDSDGQTLTAPFDHGEQYWVELELP